MSAQDSDGGGDTHVPQRQKPKLAPTRGASASLGALPQLKHAPRKLAPLSVRGHAGPAPAPLGGSTQSPAAMKPSVFRDDAAAAPAPAAAPSDAPATAAAPGGVQTSATPPSDPATAPSDAPAAATETEELPAVAPPAGAADAPTGASSPQLRHSSPRRSIDRLSSSGSMARKRRQRPTSARPSRRRLSEAMKGDSHRNVYEKAMHRLDESVREFGSYGPLTVTDGRKFEGNAYKIAPAEDPTERYLSITSKVVRQRGEEFQKSYAATVLEYEKLKKSFSNKHVSTFLLLPDSKFKSRWDIFITIAIIYVATLLPVDLGFEVTDSTIWTVLDSITDLLFLMDLAVQFRTAVVAEGGRLVTDPAEISRLYLRGWFAMDLLAGIPYDTIWFVALRNLDLSPRWRYFRLLKSLRTLRVLRALKDVPHNRFVSVWKVARLVFFYILCIHWFGCTFHFIGLVETDREPETVWFVSWGILNGTFADRYWASTHASMAQLAGNSLEPVNFIERMYGTFLMAFGACINAALFGQVAELLADRDSVFNRYRQEMEVIDRNMRVLQLPEEVRQRVRNFGNFQFQRNRMLDQSSFLQRLSGPLGVEVALFLHRDMVTSVPLFKDTSAQFVASLVRALQHKLYMPGDFIIHFGEYGSEMYFINSGECNVISEQGNMVLATLGAKEYFGELALLAQMKRTATIQAKTYCDLSVFTRYELDRLLDMFPDVEPQMQRVAKARVQAFMKAAKAAKNARRVGLRAMRRAGSYRRGLLAKGRSGKATAAGSSRSSKALVLPGTVHEAPEGGAGKKYRVAPTQQPLPASTLHKRTKLEDDIVRRASVALFGTSATAQAALLQAQKLAATAPLPEGSDDDSDDDSDDGNDNRHHESKEADTSSNEEQKVNPIGQPTSTPRTSSLASVASSVSLTDKEFMPVFAGRLGRAVQEQVQGPVAARRAAVRGAQAPPGIARPTATTTSTDSDAAFDVLTEQNQALSDRLDAVEAKMDRVIVMLEQMWSTQR